MVLSVRWRNEGGKGDRREGRRKEEEEEEEREDMDCESSNLGM